MKYQKKEFQANTGMTATLMISKIKYFLNHNNLVFLDNFFKYNIYHHESIWFCEKLQKFLILKSSMCQNENYMNKLKYFLNLKIYITKNKFSYLENLLFQNHLYVIEQELENLIKNPKTIKYEEF